MLLFGPPEHQSVFVCPDTRPRRAGRPGWCQPGRCRSDTCGVARLSVQGQREGLQVQGRVSSLGEVRAAALSLTPSRSFTTSHRGDF